MFYMYPIGSISISQDTFGTNRYSLLRSEIIHILKENYKCFVLTFRTDLAPSQYRRSCKVHCYNGAPLDPLHVLPVLSIGQIGLISDVRLRSFVR